MDILYSILVNAIPNGWTELNPFKQKEGERKRQVRREKEGGKSGEKTKTKYESIKWRSNKDKNKRNRMKKGRRETGKRQCKAKEKQTTSEWMKAMWSVKESKVKKRKDVTRVKCHARLIAHGKFGAGACAIWPSPTPSFLSFSCICLSYSLAVDAPPPLRPSTLRTGRFAIFSYRVASHRRALPWTENTFTPCLWPFFLFLFDRT